MALNEFDFVLLFLLVHFLAVYFSWYQSFPEIDILTHFLGGIVLGIFVPSIEPAVFLILLWEAIEIFLVRKESNKFKETWQDKLRDVIAGFLGYVIGAGV